MRLRAKLWENPTANYNKLFLLGQSVLLADRRSALISFVIRRHSSNLAARSARND